jgi:hypothetical protein
VSGSGPAAAFSFAAPPWEVNARRLREALDRAGELPILPPMMRTLLLLPALLLTASCEPRPPGQPPDAVPAERRPAVEGRGESLEPDALLDPAYPLAAHGEEWGHRQVADADLTSDGNLERVVLAARVERHRGRLAWDDGQPWQLYVEDADGNRTLLLSGYVQLGTLTMRVTRPEELERQAIVVLEHLPDRMSLYEFDYAAPGTYAVRRIYQRGLDPRGEIASPQFP